MSKEKHTPGPWSAVFNRGEINVCIGVGRSEKLPSGGTYTEMVCNTILPDTDEEYLEQRGKIEADAQLIAAAPQMYFQLEQAKTVLEIIDPKSPAIKQIEAVLKKAKPSA